jgi:hypothetical protein
MLLVSMPLIRWASNLQEPGNAITGLPPRLVTTGDVPERQRNNLLKIKSAGSEMEQQLIFWPFIPVQTE